MTREEAIEVLKKTTDNTIEMTIREWEAFDLDLAEAIDMAIEALSAKAEAKCVARIEVDTEEMAKRIQEEYSIMDRWIPCSERLPKEDARYLVQMSYGMMQVLSWANDLEKVDDFDFYNEKHSGWYEYDSEWGYCERHEVVAWMPLPKPYREEGAE